MSNNNEMPIIDTPPKGRATPLQIDDIHYVNQSILSAEPKNGQQKIIVGMGCFWGAERLFWQIDGVLSTAVGYSGGLTPNPTYEEVCSGTTGHTEVVRIIYDPNTLTLDQLLAYFWEHHDPTQGMRQGNDIGTQYRSAIYYYNDEQKAIIERSQKKFQQLLESKSLPVITTEIQPAKPFYYAESYHQQYLAKNPDGYCGLKGTGVCFPSQD
ncbi:peptide-methionine (S)-S-oxide reductase MsrA [Vibrio sp. RC27]